jgi:hypothetical protein
MQLPKGGLFDNTETWRAAHISHRKGKNADISRYYVRDNGSLPSLISVYIKFLARDIPFINVHLERTREECSAYREGQEPCIHIIAQ